MLKGLVTTLALVFTTAGCGADISGTTGITVNGSGDVLAIAKGCGKTFDGASLYRNTRDDNLTTVADWDLAPGVSGPETFVWHITGGARDARFANPPTLSLDSFDQSTHYTLRAATTDPNTVIGDAEFTGADLKHLQPGLVLMVPFDPGNQPEEYPTETVSRAKFNRIACSVPD